MNAPAQTYPGLRLLVVEDEAFIAMEVEEMLHELRCEVVDTASTVDRALACVRRGGIDGALLDANLHGASVLPVAEELAGSAVPFVLLTGYSRRESDPPLPSRGTQGEQALQPLEPVGRHRRDAAPLSHAAVVAPESFRQPNRSTGVEH